MIVGVGMDLVQIHRFDKWLFEKSELLIKRLLSDQEYAAFTGVSGDRHRSQWLAGRFSAKEAFLKALGIGMNQGIRMRDIEVIQDASGKPSIYLSITIRERIGFTGTCQLNLINQGFTAAAVVILEQGENGWLTRGEK